MTQHELIIKHLEAGGSLTVKEALEKYGIYALSQRVGELKNKGHDISSETVHDERTGKRYARYFIKEETPMRAPQTALDERGQVCLAGW